MYEYFGVGLEIREEVAGIFLRFSAFVAQTSFVYTIQAFFGNLALGD